MTTTVTAKIQLRKGTAAQWTSANPTLLSGEVGYETDTHKLKLGDGTTAWTALAYHHDPDLAATYAALAHTHTGVYEPANANLQAHVSSTANPHSVTAAQAGADATGTASSAVSAHAGGTGVHAIAGVTGLQTALDAKSATSHDHAATYAPIAKGVTNGDSHDHSGGDGAQIAYSGLSGLPTLGTAAATASGDYATAGHTHAQLHDAVTVSDSTSIDLTLTGQQVSAAAIFGTASGTVCQGNDSRVVKAIPSDITGIAGADAITNIVSLTQAEYDAIGSKSATTFYIIVG